jgi:hypothetical protein
VLLFRDALDGALLRSVPATDGVATLVAGLLLAEDAAPLPLAQALSLHPCSAPCQKAAGGSRWLLFLMPSWKLSQLRLFFPHERPAWYPDSNSF